MINERLSSLNLLSTDDLAYTQSSDIVVKLRVNVKRQN